jgi:sugar/nucleoside kinase (ribokinase family)
METRRGILTAGTWCVDTNKIVTHWPEEDGIAEYRTESREGGGAACNLALDMRALDPTLPVETIAVVGNDENGAWLRSVAVDAGIDARQMRMIEGAPTHISDAFVSELTRRRTHIHRPGAADLLEPDHFDFRSTKAKLLHLGMPGCHQLMDATSDDGNGWVTVLRRAKQAGLRTNLEVASVSPETLRRVVVPCFPFLDILMVNDAEIGALTGIRTITDGKTDLDACSWAAQSALTDGAMAIVVVHSPSGAVVVERGKEPISQRPVPIPRDFIAGTNGAGDAFAAGVLYRLHEDWTLSASLILGHATAAASLRDVSATKGVVPWANCLALAGEWGMHGPLH